LQKEGSNKTNREEAMDIDFPEFPEHDAGPVAVYLLLAVALLILTLS